MNRQQSGFTLIELIAVIVILGILAATAVPRFINLSDAARQAAAESLAGSIESASAINYAGVLALNADLTISGTQPIDVTDCDTATANSLLEGSLPAGYTVSGDDGLGMGVVGDCALEHNDIADVPFVIYGAVIDP